MPQPAPGSLTRLYAATTALTREVLGQEQLSELIVERVADLLEAKYAALAALEGRGKEMVRRAESGFSTDPRG